MVVVDDEFSYFVFGVYLVGDVVDYLDGAASLNPFEGLVDVCADVEDF